MNSQKYQILAKSAWAKQNNKTPIWLKINNQRFSCDCGCDLFSHPFEDDDSFYKCNGCGRLYEAKDE